MFIRFIQYFNTHYRSKRLHRYPGIIIYLLLVYCGVGQTAFNGRLAVTVDSRLPNTGELCNWKDWM